MGVGHCQQMRQFHRLYSEDAEVDSSCSIVKQALEDFAFNLTLPHKDNLAHSSPQFQYSHNI